VPAREKRAREKVVAADSVIFRRAGRQAAATPYINQNSSATTTATINIEPPLVNDNDSDDDSSDDDDILQYRDIQPGEYGGTESLDRYLGLIGRNFKDIDDGIEFCIVSVCREVPDTRGRRRYKGLCFKYKHVNKPTEFEYTPCQELLNSSWCRWNETNSASARQNRANDRHNSPPIRRVRGKKTVSAIRVTEELPTRNLRTRITKRKRGDEDSNTSDP
jgi:hypothetical protein